MSRFNLIDEKWIPVRFLDGTRDELGIRDTLHRSKEISFIEDSSPLVVASLHRFLLAVLYRALEGPTDIDQAKALFSSGLPEELITDYLERWRGRFWLFDEEYPFGQNTNVPESQIEPWTKLTAEYNASSNKVLFDHTNTKKPGSAKPNQCARWLISTMCFSISGGRGYYPSPSPNAIMCIPIGSNLFETLCYSLVPYPNKTVMMGDTAIWERDQALLPFENRKRMPFGYADLYTWPSRMVLFKDESLWGVKTMRFAAGQGFENSTPAADPMQPHQMVKARGISPVQFKTNKGTWRDFDSLLPDSSGLAPLTIQNAVRLAGNNTCKLPKSVIALGLRYDPPSANVSFWRMERFVLPEALGTDRFIRTEIHQLLSDAEEAQSALWLACRTFARQLLSRGGREPAVKDVRNFVDQMSANGWYWSVMESHFHEILRDYGLDRDADDIRRQWLESVRGALRGAWEQHSASVAMGDAWAIRALVKAEKPVRDKLKELSNEIMKLEPNKEVI